MLIVAAAAIVAALVGASTAHASKFIQKGIYDDAQILYGNPDKVFPSLAAARHPGDPRQPLVGRAERRRHAASRRIAANPADPAYDWATYDRTVRYAFAFKMAPIFTVIGTPSWANESGGVERGSDAARRTCRPS